MNRNSVQLGTFVLWTIGVAGCGAKSLDQRTFEREPTRFSSAELKVTMSRLQQLDHDVALGEAGSDVRAVHAYLTR